jgi:hypothetical protein
MMVTPSNGAAARAMRRVRLRSKRKFWPSALLGGKAEARDDLAQAAAAGPRSRAACAICAASRMAAMRLLGFAMPRPAMPRAVPWSGEVRMKGRPKLTLMPPWKSSVFTGISAWS